MTEIPPSMDSATSLAVFLSSVCPSLPGLDDNIHFVLATHSRRTKFDAIENLNWPLTRSNVSSTAKARLDRTYLNVSRPPFQQDVHKNIESTTYVPMPLHYADLFARLVSDNGDQKQDGGKHVGANFNPLLHDPYHLVHLNPGCISSMIVMQNRTRTLRQQGHESHNPFNKVTSSINRLLRIGGVENSHPNYWQSLLSYSESDGHGPVSLKSSAKKSLHDVSAISSLIDFNKQVYTSLITSPETSKLLVSSHTNVINVFALDGDNNFACTSVNQSTSQLFPQVQTTIGPSTQSSNVSFNSVHSSTVPYEKAIEQPVLRIQLNCKLMVTSMITTSNDMLIILGLNNGDILIINLLSLTFRHFNDLGINDSKGFAVTPKSKAITSLCVSRHPTHGLLVMAGYATGEVIILDPSASPNEGTTYVKEVVGNDRFSTYFKLFDLSGWSQRETSTDDQRSPPYLVGHLKLSDKPITSIATTLPYESSVNQEHNPMIFAFASEDGLVRFVDLTATYGKNYGNPNNFYHSSIMTDMVSNYFQDGIRSIDFSSDNKFFVLCGKGDLVEIFKMTYYNVNALLHKKTGASVSKGGRSRSGTLNSSNSNLHSSPSFLGLGATSASFDIPRNESMENYYAPTIKDIAIVSRLKGHCNIVQKVKFVSDDQYFGPSNSARTGTYNLISCGGDGKINFWEFNNKALPRTKKNHFTTSAKRLSHTADSPLVPQLSSLSSRRKTSATPDPGRQHIRNRSYNHSEDLPLQASFSKLGINNLLSSTSHAVPSFENNDDHLQIVFSLYKSLYDMRLKRHYAGQKKDLKSKYPCVVHGIVNDKDLPSIQVPLLTVDMSCFIKNGHLSGFHCDQNEFWIYGKSGDIFRYRIGT